MTEKTSNPTSRGVWDVKRRVKLPTLRSDADIATATRCVESLPGVHEVRADLRRQRLTVLYDLRKTGYRQILDTLADNGHEPPDTRWSRLKAGWFQDLDENGRQNSRVMPSPCCSQPPRGAGKLPSRH